MRSSLRYALIAASSIVLLGTASCATNEDLEALRTELKAEVAAVRDTANQAMQRANTAYILAQQGNDAAAAAASQAQEANAAAAAADAKAERIYAESLSK